MGGPHDTMVRVIVSEDPMRELAAHGTVSIAFTVASVLDATTVGARATAITLTERKLTTPYGKDYDVVAGNRPVDWARRFDVSNWGLLAARRDGRRVGGAVLAHRTPGVDMLEGRDDLAALWDLRVAPDTRRSGVGAALFAAAEDWARARGCIELRIETQNINVPACRFYAAQGCVLRDVDLGAYPEFQHEVRFVWRKDLVS